MYKSVFTMAIMQYIMLPLVVQNTNCSARHFTVVSKNCKISINWAPRTFPERKNPESKNPECNNPNLFSGIYVIIPKKGLSKVKGAQRLGCQDRMTILSFHLAYSEGKGT